MKKKYPPATSPAPIRPLKFQMEHSNEEVRVEIVPLIDVIFCILTFFILAAVGLSRQQAITVDLPKASTGTRQGQEILIVSLSEFGQVFVEQEPVQTQADFQQKLRQYLSSNPNGLMALYASENATYNEVVQVLDVLRSVGGNRVALATLSGQSIKPSGSFPAPPPTGVPNLPSTPGTNPNQQTLPGLPGLLLPGSPGTNPSPQPAPEQAKPKPSQ
ncbi:MAG: biopolymer transporter ExbD [Symploca sp. SIO3C6]|uniref:Biopolymer transporter ExbD n=1 Tax=Symploca sp. SIO1C4 TaxID=2607765 RepID=A0A6B3NF40_9CYAN|nr:biopolymer transporter ExbD [Symploca sp. SIO3C6]NER29555.1 biopolymer transporter ExbD [Symploca sp. SIO1C4]